MGKKRIWIGLALVVFGLLLFWLSFQGESSSPIGVFSQGPSVSPTAPSTAAVATAPGSVAPAPAEVSPAFSQFLREEGQRLDQPSDPESTEARLLAQAEAMGQPEIRYLQSRALLDRVPAGERILSVYLLGLAGPKAWPALRELLRTRLPERDTAPHSVGSVRNMQEKASQRMAVDQLAEQAKKDPGALRQMEEAAAESPDPDLRAYILSKIQEVRRGL